VFHPVVEVAVLAGLHSRQYLLLRGTIAFQLIGDDHPWHVGQPLEQLTEKLLRGLLVAAALHKNIHHVAVLVDGAPQVVAFALDREEDLIEGLLVARSGTPAAELMGVNPSEFPAPIPHRFIRQDDATFGHQLFHVAVAEAEAEIHPDTVADDLGREPLALIQVGWWCIHAASMPHEGRCGRGKVNLTMPGTWLQMVGARIPDKGTNQ
jgi:hypothetical protein